MAITRDTLFPLAVRLAAQASERENGILACVTLAQWAHESGYGRYSMGLAHNPFGIKWPGPKSGLKFVVMRTWEVLRGKRVTVDAKFTAFPSIEAAFKFHGRMLARPDGYYKRAYPLRKSWGPYVEAIAPIYATDPAYAERITTIILRWKLYEFNLPPKAPAAFPAP